MVAETRLTEELWCLLDSLVEGPQPFEQVYAEYAARSPSATPDDLRADLARLQAIGLLSVDEFSTVPAEAQGTPGPTAPPSAGIKLTLQGKVEWDDARYEMYWRDSTPSPLKPFAIPLRVQYTIAGLWLLLTVVAVWGFLQATWSVH